MSIKSRVFELALHGFGPANLYQYVVYIGNAVNMTFLVEEATIPPIERQEIRVPLPGIQISMPGPVQGAGEFNCTIVETQTFTVNWSILRALMTTGVPFNGGNKENEVLETPSGLFDCIIMSLQGAEAPTFTTLLSGCYIKSRGGVTLSASNATGYFKWPISIVYNRNVNEVTEATMPLVLDALLAANIAVGKGLNKLV